VAIGLGNAKDPWKYIDASSPIENSSKSSGQNHTSIYHGGLWLYQLPG